MDTWQTDAGLPELAIQAIVEASDGYLWIGTQEGLARFDGAQFTVFDHVNTPALKSDFISTLVEDGDHTLWIGNTQGLAVRRADGKFSTFGSEQGFPFPHVSMAVADGDGSIWVGGRGGVAHIVHGRVERVFGVADGLASDVIGYLAIDADGALWVTSRGHLNRIKSGKVENFSDADGLKGHTISGLFAGRGGRIVVLSSGAGFFRRVGDHFEQWWPDGVPENVHIRDLLEDRDGNIWIATDANGVFRTWQHVLSGTTSEQGLSDIGTQTLFEDSGGNLWIGTLGRGLIRLRDGSFTAYTKTEGLSADSVFSVLEDRHGDVWAGTLNGLTRISIDEVRRYSRATGLSGNYISALGDDNAGGIWVGLGGTGLDHLTNGNVDRHISLKPPLQTSIVTAIVADRTGTLWAGTDGAGVARIAGDKTDYLTTQQGLPENFISAIAEDAHGAIWIGTNNGMGKVDGDRFDANTLHDDELRNSAILSLYVDDCDALWIGTMGHGLWRYSAGHLTHYTMREGLPNETINSILTDAEDNVWLGSNRGIFRIRRNEIDDVAAGRRATMDVTRFGQDDGMKSAETSAGSQPTAWRSSDGRLWFATVQGAVVIDPTHLATARTPLHTFVESVRANDRLVDARAGNIDLAAGTSRLEIRYTAPDLMAAETTRFRYRLDGVDSDWIDVGAERTARYSNVPPGTRRFEVQARRDNEGWSGAATALTFDVAPMFYQTWWFAAACAALFAALLWFLHHLRVKWLHMQSAVADERRRIAGEIHDSLAQGFSAISVQIEAALGRLDRAPDLAVSHLKLARDVSRTSLSEARRSVWNLQSPPPSHTTLVAAIVAACEQIAYGHGASVSVEGRGHAWAVNPSAENHLVRICQEAVSNAIHHGGAAEIHIDAMYTFNQLILTVVDDGAGFEPAAARTTPGRGFGLANMRRRAAATGGRLDIASAQGVGTRITVTLPRIAMLNRLWRELRAPKASA
ncbi:MAG TPA: two-component regulator propeller domain-containing protein [Rudaea sp.]|jgi:signal transduction histidine kinase|nr:two-component regulator propeller domain-containing protein [Rudaea sp.]